MAKMNGCNEFHSKQMKPQGTSKINPGSFARNNLSKGGVNDHLGGTKEAAPKMGLKSGQNGQGKYRHDK